jgi:hypothetical protein
MTVRNPQFNRWLSRVNDAIQDLCGLSKDDLPDCDFWCWWAAGIKPAKAARMAIRAAKDLDPNDEDGDDDLSIPGASA